MEQSLFPARYANQDAVQKSALSWADRVLQNDYKPPPHSRFVLTAHSESVPCDFARLAYVVDGSDVVVTELRVVMSVCFAQDPSRARAIASADAVQRLARRAFLGGNTLELVVDSSNDAGVFGGGARREQRSNDNAPWLNGLKWRSDDDGVVFWFLKDPGEPTMGVISGSPEINRHWFKRR